MTREEIKELVGSHLPFAVKNRNGKLVYPYINTKVAELIIETTTDLICKILNKLKNKRHESK
mgnify:CR=1 FL=1